MSLSFPAWPELKRDLAGAARLLRFDPDGLRVIDTSWGGARRSFWAAALALPAFIILNLLAGDDAPQVGGALRLVVEAICYILQWTVMPVLAWQLCVLWKREERYPHLIAAFNWLYLPRAVAYLALALLDASGALPQPVMNAAVLVLVIYVLWAEGFVARLALDIGAMAACCVVGLDILIAWQVSLVRLQLLAH